MEGLFPLLIGGAIGLFVGLQLLPARSPQVMVVQIEQEDPQSGGGFGCFIVLALVGLVALVLLLSVR
jgi:hypothetical protein